MKTKVLAKKSKKTGYRQLVSAISLLSSQMVRRVATAANHALVLRNWIVGACIVEFEQDGADRAKYGERLLERLASDLTAKGVKGLDERTLRDCRGAYFMHPQIRGAVTPELTATLALPEAGIVVDAEVEVLPPPIRGTLSPESRAKPIRGTLSPELPTPLSCDDVLDLSWSRIQELIRISDPWKRAFFENECLREGWSVRDLQRQIESLLYERTGLSINKKAVIERARRQAGKSGPESIAELMRDPYILEFTGLAERHEYTEEQLESALLDHLQRFLLELGRGFCFESRQFRMTSGRKHHRVDALPSVGELKALVESDRAQMTPTARKRR